MTPKEKAVELYEKMYYAIHIDGNQDYKDSADRATLIAVNEVLNTLFQHNEIDYWKEVREEVKKL